MKLRGFATATTIISVDGDSYLLGNRGFPFGCSRIRLLATIRPLLTKCDKRIVWVKHHYMRDVSACS